MKNWDKILDDFARKCKGGSPDMTNPRHLALLRESLIKFGWKENATNEFIGNLREKVGKVYYQGKPPKGASVQVGPRGGKYYIGNPDTGEPVKPDEIPTDDEPSEKDLKSKETKRSKAYLKTLDIDIPKGMTDQELVSASKTEYERRKFLSNTVNLMIEELKQTKSGAGAREMTKDQWVALKDFAEGKGPEIKQYEVSEEDIDDAIDLIKKSGKKGVMSFLQNKGAADKDSTRKGTVDDRGPGWNRDRKMIKSYLACGGLSAVTGKPLSIGTSNVDHRLPLDSGGKDEPDNWIWMETEMNMNKSSLTDKDLIEKAKKALSITDDEKQKKQLTNIIKNESKKFVTEHYKTLFEMGGNGGVTEDDLKGMTYKEIKAITYGWNKLYPKTSDLYINTYESQKAGSRGEGGRGVKLKKGDLIKNVMKRLSKKERVLTSEEIEALNGQLQEGIDEVKRKAEK
jgi:hypothetical protein